MPRPIRVVAPHHAFTLDELQAFDEDEGALAPERAALIQAHFDEGCLACRSWLANRDELELLAGAVGALPPEGWRGRLVVAWRRTVALERLPVLLLAVPLKALLVREMARRERGWLVRAGAAFGIAGLTLAVLRYVLARPRVIVPPDGPAPVPARHESAASTYREPQREPRS